MRVPQEVRGHPAAARRVVHRRSGQSFEQLLDQMDLLTIVLEKGESVYMFVHAQVWMHVHMYVRVVACVCICISSLCMRMCST